MTHLLFNPLSNNGKGKDHVSEITERFPDREMTLGDITKIGDIAEYLKKLGEDDDVILAGGDGTINRFVNDIGDYSPKNDIYYYPLGSGNDFFNDVKDFADENRLVLLNNYIKDLPWVTVNGITRRFINGIGCGIDGYCCEEGDKKRARAKGRINYTTIAIKGLLFFYKAPNATVTVDGKVSEYKKVYLVPSMKGRFYGGGMMIAPLQDRLSADGKLTAAIAHGCSRMKILVCFPSVFKGEHIKYSKIFDMLKGDEITVKLDRPTALQIDGETVRNVTEYSVKSAAAVNAEKKTDTDFAEA